MSEQHNNESARITELEQDVAVLTIVLCVTAAAVDRPIRLGERRPTWTEAMLRAIDGAREGGYRSHRVLLWIQTMCGRYALYGPVSRHRKNKSVDDLPEWYSGLVDAINARPMRFDVESGESQQPASVVRPGFLARAATRPYMPT
jgi:hypothetical protein